MPTTASACVTARLSRRVATCRALFRLHPAAATSLFAPISRPPPDHYGRTDRQRAVPTPLPFVWMLLLLCITRGDALFLGVSKVSLFPETD